MVAEIKRVRWDGRKAIEGSQAAVSHGLWVGAEFILAKANETVPLEESPLKASGTTKVDNERLRAYISYDTPYAVRQHEETTWQHKAGRRAKWLELTMREQAKEAFNRVADAVKKHGGLGGGR